MALLVSGDGELKTGYPNILTPLSIFDNVLFQEHRGLMSRRACTISLFFTFFRDTANSMEELWISMVLTEEFFFILAG